MGNLLFLAHRLPYPPNKGDKVRSYHLLKHLARRHRVYLGTFVDDPDDERYVENLRPLCADVHAVKLKPRHARLRSLSGLLNGEPLTLPYYRSKNLASWVERVVREHEIDTAVVFSSPMAQYVEGLPQLRVLVDFVDVDSAKWQEYAATRAWPASWIYGREGRKLLAAERAIALRVSHSFFVTPAETALFLELAPECAGTVQPISNGVDAEFFKPDSARSNPYSEGELPIVFTGAMDYWPNIDAVRWFASEMMPELRSRWPQARFYIVGMRPSAAVQGLASDSIVVTGTVPDVRPYLQYAAVAVAPLRVARGIQNKVLEAMAMEAPVVASKACAQAIEGLTPAEAISAEGTREFIHAVDSLLQTREVASAIGKAARRFILSSYSWDSRLAPIDSYLSRSPSVPAAAPRIAAETAV